MIICKENVVRYIVEIDSAKTFNSKISEGDYLLEQFLRDGMESEVDKMIKKGWSFRVIEENSYTRTYAVEYKTRVTY